MGWGGGGVGGEEEKFLRCCRDEAELQLCPRCSGVIRMPAILHVASSSFLCFDSAAITAAAATVPVSVVDHSRGRSCCCGV